MFSDLLFNELHYEDYKSIYVYKTLNVDNYYFFLF